jgi:Polymer-forming cytoskeletal
VRRSIASYSSLILVGFLGAFMAPVVALCQKNPSIPSSPSAPNQRTNSDQVDSFFTTIHLGPGGVTAVGENGASYKYDFDADSFTVAEESAGDQLDRNNEGGVRRDIEPVETRCIDRVDVPPFAENVVIGETEYVEGDIIATGRVTIKGWVKGNVQSLNRRVLVTESGRVDGDVEAPEITIKGDGVVLGNQIVGDAEGDAGLENAGASEEGLWVIFGFTLFFLTLGFVLISIIPVRIERFERCVTRYRWRSFLLGVVLTFLLPFLVAIAGITIIGIPIAVALPIVFVFAGAVGVIIAGLRVSQYLTHRYAPFVKQKLAHLLIGVPAVMLIWLVVAILLGTPDDVSQGFGTALLVFSIVASSFAVALGVGAAFLTRLGSRDYVTLRDKVFGEQSAPAPAPPPKPDFPPAV